MRDAVEAYRDRREKRLAARMDDEEERNQPNNAGKKSGGHGNTRLPYGLCQRYGIDVQKDWSPRDAWSALADKGITPESEFGRRNGGTFKGRFGGIVYRNPFAKKSRDGGYSLYGDFDTVSPFSGKKETREKSMYCSFVNKDELFAFLKENGIKRFKDPDSGEIVNPQKISVPETVAKVDEKRYVDLVLGYRKNKDGKPLDRRGYTITGKGFDGKKSVLKVCDSPKEAIEYAKKIGCPNEKLRRTADYKKLMERIIGGK